MNPITAIGAFLMGGVLGVAYFGGLWLTVRSVTMMQSAPSWFVASFVLRMSMVLASFFLVLRGGWESLVICVLGFLAARIALTTYLGKSEEYPN